MNHEVENTNRPLALILTLLSHGVLLILFLFFYITTPIPPYPEGGGSGMGVNFGLADEGYGEEQPEKLIPLDIHDPVHEQKNVKPQNTTTDNDILTQNSEETEALKTEENKKENEVKKENEKEATINNEEKKEEKQVNKKALFPGSDKNNNSKNEGDKKGTSGDQGKPDGNPKNKFKWGEGNGLGQGNGTGDGKGNGTGDGEGDGDGPGKNKKGGKGDKGVSFNLAGRKAENLPPPSYDDNDEGKVVVEVIVDREGKVTKVSEGEGSTTSSRTLINAALNAAKKAKFSKNPDAAEFQKGTITYHFKQL